MSSFFSTPASQRKRKQGEASISSSAHASKRRNLDPGAGRGRERGAGRGRGKDGAGRTPRGSGRPRQGQQRQQQREDDDDSISGSDSSHNEGGASSAVRRHGSDAGTEITATDSEDGSSDGEDQTAAERRLKLAERYLKKIRAEVDEEQEVGFDARDIDRDLIASRLKEDADEEQGKLYRRVAEGLDYTRAAQTFFRADTLATTGVAACPPYIYTVSKDSTIIKWHLGEPLHYHEASADAAGHLKNGVRRKPKQLKYINCYKQRVHEAEGSRLELHTGAILCIAVSTTGKYVATGGADKKLIIWDGDSLTPLKVFMQHRDAVTSLAFRGRTNQLFSGSKDRSVKIWSLDELAYIETLFGHQDEVVDVAAAGGSQERCVSVGARDRTARLWKVVEESQLVFRGGGKPGHRSETANSQQRQDDKSKSVSVNGLSNGNLINGLRTAGDPDPPNALLSAPPVFAEMSLERVIQPSTQLFVTGSDAGALSLYSLHKKKAMHVVALAHGWDPAPALEDWSAEASPSAEKVAALLKHGPQPRPRAITALACIPGSDLFLSGSWDGTVRVWGISADQKRIERLAVLDGQAAQYGPGSGSTTAALVAAGEGAVGVSDKKPEPRFRGVINDLSVFERGERGKDGVSVVVAVGTEHRFGRWTTPGVCVPSVTKESVTDSLAEGAASPAGSTGMRRGKKAGVKNGAFVVDIPRLRKGALGTAAETHINNDHVNANHVNGHLANGSLVNGGLVNGGLLNGDPAGEGLDAKGLSSHA